MADINTVTVGKSKKTRMRHHLIRIDMTPMVDLGFLLITFFIFNSVMAKPMAMKLMVPVDGPSTPSPVSKTLTLLLNADGNVLCYEGFAKNNATPRLISLYNQQSSLRTLIQQKIKALGKPAAKDQQLFVIIKPTELSNYNSLVTVFDEMIINGVEKYALAEPDDDDRKLLADTH